MVVGAVAGDLAGPYVVVVDQTPAGLPYKEAGERLAQFRHAAAVVPLTAEGQRKVFERLAQLKPACVAFVVPPGRIEDNFVGELFERASTMAAGPELDFAWGFITGATPQEALNLVRNTERAERERGSIQKIFVAVGHTFREADLGPFAYEQALWFERYGYRTFPLNPIDESVDWQWRVNWEMRHLEGASLVFFAGHGLGDRMCGIDAEVFQGFQLDRAVVISGPCHSAVTTLRHDVQPGSLGIKAVPLAPERSICLRLIKSGAVAQVGSTASSSWGNVGPVVTGFFNRGLSMGEALRTRLNEHLRQKGIRSFKILPFEEGKPSPQFIRDERNPGDIQSVARVVLIGDPAYCPFPEGQPVHPFVTVTNRPHPMASVARPLLASAAPAAAAPPQNATGKDISKTAVAELIARLDQTPSADFRELQEIIKRGKEAVPPLIAALRTSESWQVPKALGALKDPRAVDPLIDALARRNWSPYKEVTIEALEMITGKKAGSDAEAWRKAAGSRARN